ncbi:hypothetical protein FQA47_015957 [Oryzias melastigma]|uniref:Uncharacterized protein n=1 Tax=Oryzias melastigma TaxID=30732 RepID=A0A834F3A1_ORYME|nr:hypothetical protein FQA47_015957 [Oryzias melastigma]
MPCAVPPPSAAVCHPPPGHARSDKHAGKHPPMKTEPPPRPTHGGQVGADRPDAQHKESGREKEGFREEV